MRGIALRLDKPNSVTALADGAPGPTGDIRWYMHRTYGLQFYRLCYNNSGGALSQYAAPIYDLGAGASSINTDAQAGAGARRWTIPGIPQVAVADASYYWALCGGDGLVLLDVGADGSAIRDNRLRVTAAGGQCDDAAAAADQDEFFCVALANGTNPVPAGETVRVRIYGLM